MVRAEIKYMRCTVSMRGNAKRDGEGEKDLYQLAIDSSVKVSTEMEMFWKVKTVY